MAANSEITDPNIVYAELAAGAETGWDYSSRWLSDRTTLPSIDTRHVIPTDLNSIMYKNERTLASMHTLAAQQLAAAAVVSGSDASDAVAYHTALAADYTAAANTRQSAIHTLLWMPDHAQWADLHLTNSSLSHIRGVSSNFIPLWAEVYPSDTDRDAIVSAFLASGLYQNGGVCTTLAHTGLQWDWPNAWPPIQHLLIDGFEALDTIRSRSLAFDMAQRWVSANLIAFNQTAATSPTGTGVMFEKYDCTVLGGGGGGGEYELQTGFGWTNGVALDLLNRFGDRLTPP